MTKTLGGSAGANKTRIPPGTLSEALKSTDIQHDRELYPCGASITTQMYAAAVVEMQYK